LARGFLLYSLDLLELSEFPEEPLELSDFPEEPPELSDLPELSDAPDLLEPSDELLFPLSEELLLEPSLLSALTGRGAPEGDLWSVAYQPEPLKTIPAGVNTFRRLFLLHSGQRFKGSSVND
jgi:hypothetical protein